MPKISIIVPVYNAEKYIVRCIESVLSQDFTDWEMILVDDNSTDNSVRVIKEHIENESRISIIESDFNQGPMIAREMGYLASKGEYITFLDSDDSLPADSLSQLYSESIKSYSDITVGDIIMIEENGNMTSFNRGASYGLFSKKEILPLLLNGTFPHNLCAKLFKAELFRYGNLHCESEFINGEDGLLFYQILENVKTISVINKTVYYYWMHSTSSSHRLLVTEQIMRGMVAQDKYKFDFFKRNNSVLNNSYYENLYNSVAYNSSIFLPKKVRSLYYASGLNIDVSLNNLSQYYRGIQLIKIYIKCHYLYYYNYIKSAFVGNQIH